MIFVGTRTEVEVEDSGFRSPAGALDAACVIACLMNRPAAALSISARSTDHIMRVALRSREVARFTCGWGFCIRYLVEILLNTILIWVRVDVMWSSSIFTNSGTTACVFGSMPRDLR